MEAQILNFGYRLPEDEQEQLTQALEVMFGVPVSHDDWLELGEDPSALAQFRRILPATQDEEYVALAVLSSGSEFSDRLLQFSRTLAATGYGFSAILAAPSSAGYQVTVGRIVPSMQWVAKPDVN